MGVLMIWYTDRQGNKQRLTAHGMTGWETPEQYLTRKGIGYIRVLDIA